MAYYDDEFSLKKILLLALVFFIILEGALLGICALINSNQSLRIVSKVDHGTVTYNDVDKVSSLDVDVRLRTVFINFKFRAANTVYKLIFLDKNDNVLAEHTAVHKDALTAKKTDFTVTFGEGGDHPAISGKVDDVEIEVVGFDFLNFAKAEGFDSRKEYLKKNGWNLGMLFIVLCEMVFFFDNIGKRRIISALISLSVILTIAPISTAFVFPLLLM